MTSFAYIDGVPLMHDSRRALRAKYLQFKAIEHRLYLHVGTKLFMEENAAFCKSLLSV